MTWRIDPVRSLDEIDVLVHVEHVSFSNPWTREMYVAEFANPEVSYFYLARDAESSEVAGFCAFWRVLDELHINNLAVLPEKRRHGVASALLSHILREGLRLGAPRATLEVRRSNDAALRLYEKFGFSVAGVRRRYYTNPEEDAFVLWRDELGHSSS
jgi:ribosomal-protein-alanine N-acetyltransferase